MMESGSFGWGADLDKARASSRRVTLDSRLSASGPNAVARPIASGPGAVSRPPTAPPLSKDWGCTAAHPFTSGGTAAARPFCSAARAPQSLAGRAGPECAEAGPVSDGALEGMCVGTLDEAAGGAKSEGPLQASKEPPMPKQCKAGAAPRSYATTPPAAGLTGRTGASGELVDGGSSGGLHRAASSAESTALQPRLPGVQSHSLAASSSLPSQQWMPLGPGPGRGSGRMPGLARDARAASAQLQQQCQLPMPTRAHSICGSGPFWGIQLPGNSGSAVCALGLVKLLQAS